MTIEFNEINVKTFKGVIPSGYDLVIADRSDVEFDDAMVLMDGTKLDQ